MGWNGGELEKENTRPGTKELILSWAVVAYAFNTSMWEADAGESL